MTEAAVPPRHVVQLRYRDLDPLGHVAHGGAITFFEESRDAYFAHCGIDREDYIVRACSIDYLREIPAAMSTVEVECRIESLGRSSVITAECILDDEGSVMVEARFVLVLWDPKLRGSRALSDDERAALSTALDKEARNEVLE